MFGINHALKQCSWFIVHCQKWPCLKWTHSSSALFEWVKCFDVIVDFKSNMEFANTYVVLWSSMHSIGIFKFPPWYKTMYIIIQTQNYINTNLVKPYRLCNVLAWAVRQKISHLWGAEICDKYKTSLPKVDKIHMLYTCPKLQHWKLYSNYCYTTAQNWSKYCCNCITTLQ